VDVDFGREQGLANGQEWLIVVREFHNHQIALGEGQFRQFENLERPFRIAGNDSNDGAIGGFHHSQGHKFHVGCFESASPIPAAPPCGSPGTR